MKRYALILALVCLPAFAQTPKPYDQPVSNVYAAGVSFNSAGTPKIAGTALYAHLITGGTYAFTVVDALPTNLKPFTVTTNFGAGVAQKVFTVGSVPIYIPSSAGVSFNGTNTGWMWSTGAMGSVKLKHGWHVYPHVRIAKSSVSNGAGYQPIIGVLIGYEN